MAPTLSSLTCMLCQNTIRLKEDDQLSQFEEHISDHHGVTFDTEFIYAASCLNSKERVESIIAVNSGPEDKTDDRTKSIEHKKENINKCSVCDQTFSRPWCLKNHMKVHDDKRGGICANCHDRFLTNSIFKTHIEKQVKCEECNLVICVKMKGPGYNKDSDIINHKLFHKGIVNIICHTCNDSFNFKQDLRTHEKAAHGGRSYSCIRCEKSYKTESSTASCERMHNEVYKCPKCGSNKATFVELQRHIETHDSNRGIKCDACPHISVNMKALETHVKKLHREGRHTVKCEICMKPAANKESLQEHRTRNHKDLVYLYCKVENCKQKFLQKNKFDNHMKYHQVVKEVYDDKNCMKKMLKYQCQTCKRLFNHMATLKDHELSHNEEKRFNCDECEMGFNRNYSLKVHKKIHSKVKDTFN